MRFVAGWSAPTSGLTLEKVATFVLWGQGLFSERSDEVVFVVELDDVKRMRRRVFRQRPIWGLDARVMTVAELSNALELDVHLMTVAELSKALDHRDQNVHTRATEEAEQETTVRLQMVDVSFESRRRVKYYNQASSLYIRTPDSKGVRRDRKEPLPDGVGKANFNFTVKGDSVLILEQTFHGREQNEKELGRIAGNPPALDPTLERALIAQGSTWLDWRSLIGE